MEKIEKKVKESQQGKLFLYIYKRFFKKRPLVLYFSIALLMNLTTLVIVSFKGRPENETIPLHYIAGKGVDKIGMWYEIYAIPLILFVITIINFAIAKKMKLKDEISGAYLFLSATLALQFFGILVASLIALKL